MSRTQPNFNLIARPYRWLEYLTLGRSLENCRSYFLSHLLSRRRALVIGDGDGRFLAQLLTRNTHLHADAVDTSSTMLQLLEQRCEAAIPDANTRLNCHQFDALAFPLDGSYDLIVTHFFLDCLTQSELAALIYRVAEHAGPGTLWLISDFRIPSGPMQVPAKLLVRTLYLAFRLLTGLRTNRLPEPAAPLTQAGFVQIAHQHRLAGLLTTELWQL
jgi:ubiquinone/menaquinone biosynthesis C-methylase UbiE